MVDSLFPNTRVLSQSTRDVSAFGPTLFAEVCANEGEGSNVLLSPLVSIFDYACLQALLH